MTAAIQGPPILEYILVGPPPDAVEIRLEPLAKRVRAFVGGIPIADSCRVRMMFETSRLGVFVSGQTLAVTRRAQFLFETGLPLRYYIPKDDIRMDLLQPSRLKTKTPPRRSQRLAGRIAFFNERVDAIYVDGKEMPRPLTMWSHITRRNHDARQTDDPVRPGAGDRAGSQSRRCVPSRGPQAQAENVFAA